MRGARYVRLIPWTLRSGSEQYWLVVQDHCADLLCRRIVLTKCAGIDTGLLCMAHCLLTHWAGGLLCSLIVQAHCAGLLCRLIVLAYFTDPLYWFIVQDHCTGSVYRLIILNYCAGSLYKIGGQTNCATILCLRWRHLILCSDGP